MPERVMRKYGEAAVIDFTLFETDGMNFKSDATHDTGDTKISKDEGAEINTTNGFVDNGTGYSLTLTVAEVTAKRVFVPIADQYTKQWLDDYIMIETYGHTNAMHAFNLDADLSTNTEEWKFKGIDIHHDSDFGLSVTSDTTSAMRLVAGGNGNGLDATGAGTGAGMYSAGGGTGNGVEIFGGAMGGYGDGFGVLITSDRTSALRLVAGGNGNAFDATAAGTGYGAYIKGATNGVLISGGDSTGSSNGVWIKAASTLGTGLLMSGVGVGAGMKAMGGAAGTGFTATGSGTGAGIYAKGGNTSPGHGIQAQAGTTGGHGIDCWAPAGHGIQSRAGSTGLYSQGDALHLEGSLTGSGHGHGISVTGGVTSGDGIKIVGGAVGDGIRVDTTDGHGLIIDANGANKDGVNITTANGYGIKAWSTGSSKHGFFLQAIDGNAIHLAGGSGWAGLYSGAANAEGMRITGSGAKSALYISSAEGPNTGHGVEIKGGGISGEGIKVTTTDGHAMYLRATGTYKSGLHASSAAGHGSEFVGSVGLSGAYFGGAPNGNGIEIYGGPGGIALKINGTVDATAVSIVSASASPGVQIQGGPTGIGVKIEGGAISGTGVEISSTDGHGIDIAATGASKIGINVASNASDGMKIAGGGTGNGILIEGGASGGDGIFTHALGGASANGIRSWGIGMGAGVDFAGGATGNGIFASGGITSGHGLSIVGLSDVAVKVEGGGSNHGVQLLGGISGGDGFYCAAQGGNGNGASFHKDGSGKDIDAEQLDGLLKLTTTVDGETLEYAYELMMARVNGEYDVDIPGTGDVTMRKRDNTTSLTVVHITPAGRTRIS